jgi:hypothetical protein
MGSPPATLPHTSPTGSNTSGLAIAMLLISVSAPLTIAFVVGTP